MSADDLIHRWAAKRLCEDPADVVDVEFEHEESFVNDSGTWWPAETLATVKLRGNRTRMISVPTGSDLTELIREIVAS